MKPVLLDFGIRAAQQNELSKAREFLTAYVGYNPNDEEGWLWLSRVAEDPQQKYECLLRVLTINPSNSVAGDELANMTGSQISFSEATTRTMPPWNQPDAVIEPCLPSSIFYLEPTRQTAVPASDPGQLIRSLLSGVRATLVWAGFGLALVLFLAVAAAMTPMFFGNRTLVIMSGSMQPSIPVGAAVVVQPYLSQDLQVGDVIAFNSNPDAAMPTVHRIVSIREKNGVRFYTTHGDANETADVTEVSLPAMAWRVWYNLPLVGYIINAAVRPIGIVLLIVIPVLLLFANSVFEWVKRTRPAFSS